MSTTIIAPSESSGKKCKVTLAQEERTNNLKVSIADALYEEVVYPHCRFLITEMEAARKRSPKSGGHDLLFDLDEEAMQTAKIAEVSLSYQYTHCLREMWEHGDVKATLLPIDGVSMNITFNVSWR